MGFLWCQSWFYVALLYFTATEIRVHAIAASSLQTSCSDHDRSALLQFKHSFQVDCLSYGYYPKTKSWTVGPNSDCCLWDGVECEKETGNVIKLDLSNSCLYGTFPRNSTLFGLTHLQKLNLAFNDFNYSQIPSELGQLRNLQSLNLSNSAFRGQFPPEISKLSKIIVLDLSGNANDDSFSLHFQNPTLDFLIQNLTHLQQLFLDDTDISSTIRSFLANLSSLQAISLSNCNLHGVVPTSLFRLPHLKFIHFSANIHLAGVLPSFHSNSPLVLLNLDSTRFSGELPPSIGNLRHLKTLILTNNQLSGTIPPSIGNLTSLTFLMLTTNNFIGDIPLSITNLTNLKTLRLSGLHAMSPQLRLQFHKLYRLTSIRLTETKLDCEMPSFLANLTGLIFLDLGSTGLKGQLPQWVANLTQIQQLYLGDNQLEGRIPQWISNLTMLNSLELSDNNMFGNFDMFFSLPNLLNLDLFRLDLAFPAYSRKNSSRLKLELLDLSYCNLTEFPMFLQPLTELQVLFLDGNNINGVIPQWFINTTKESLQLTDFTGNKLSGFEKPTSVLPWTNLKELDISGNEWQGPLPTPSSSLQNYAAAKNLLTGNIPESICNTRSLISLDLSNNSMSGHIPSCLGNQLGESLRLLNLRGNNLSGTIPLKFSKKCSLEMINLSENKLEGNLPRSLSNCAQLRILDVGKNGFNDTFPTWLGSQLELQVLVLRHNMFHGSIAKPKAGYEFQYLSIIDLSHNLFTGQLPSPYLQSWHKMQVSNEDDWDSLNIVVIFDFDLGSVEMMERSEHDYSITITNKGSETLYTKILTVFRVIDFSSNKFTGNIPNIIGDLKGLQALNLSNNILSGKIPPSLANITDLESLDLSLNMLSGELPQGLPQLQSLEVFNVSYNRLTGQIPQGKQFNTFDNSSYKGNLGLCGNPLSNGCRNVEATPSSVTNSSDEDSDDSGLIDWIIRSFGCLSGFISGYIIGKLYITDKYHEWFMEKFQRRPKKRTARAQRHRR